MKSIFYLLTILFLSLLISCSEEPPTGVDVENLDKKPIKDPPAEPDPLPRLVQGTNYIAGVVGGGRRSDPKVYIWDCSDLLNPESKWSRSIDAGPFVGIGDFIDDDDKELVMMRFMETGRKKNKIRWHELLIFKKDDTEPTETVFLREHNGFHDSVFDMKIGNVDNDEELEIVILFRDQIEIWEYDGNDFYLEDFSYYYNSLSIAWSAEIGNFDNDPTNGNEILVAFDGNLWRVYDYYGSSITQLTESSAFNESGTLDCAKMSDVDGDGDIEVIGGNYPNKVLLWEAPYIEPYEPVASQEFSNAAWAIGIGELDGETSNGKEILAGVYQGGLHLLHYDNVGNSLIYEDELVQGISVGPDGIIVTDIHNDNSALEIIVTTNGGLLVLNKDFSTLFTDNVLISNVICQ